MDRMSAGQRQQDDLNVECETIDCALSVKLAGDIPPIHLKSALGVRQIAKPLNIMNQKPVEQPRANPSIKRLWT